MRWARAPSLLCLVWLLQRGQSTALSAPLPRFSLRQTADPEEGEKAKLSEIPKLSISTITYLDSRGQVEVVVVFPACVHHAVQHAEDHVAEEAQVLWCGWRLRFKPRLTLMNLLKLLFFRTRHHHKIIFSSYLLLAKRQRVRDIFDQTNLLILWQLTTTQKEARQENRRIPRARGTFDCTQCTPSYLTYVVLCTVIHCTVTLAHRT